MSPTPLNVAEACVKQCLAYAQHIRRDDAFQTPDNPYKGIGVLNQGTIGHKFAFIAIGMGVMLCIALLLYPVAFHFGWRVRRLPKQPNGDADGQPEDGGGNRDGGGNGNGSQPQQNERQPGPTQYFSFGAAP